MPKQRNEAANGLTHLFAAVVSALGRVARTHIDSENLPRQG